MSESGLGIVLVGRGIVVDLWKAVVVDLGKVVTVSRPRVDLEGAKVSLGD